MRTGQQHDAISTGGDARRLAGLAGGVLLLHVLGWGLYLAGARPAFGLCALIWAGSLLIWKAGRLEEHWNPAIGSGCSR